MDGAGGPAVLVEVVDRWRLGHDDPELVRLAGVVDVLVRVAEDVYDPPLTVAQQVEQRQPPLLVEILALVDYDRVEPRLRQGLERPVEVFTYADDDAEGCRRVLATVLRNVIDKGRVPVSDVVVLTPRSPRSSWLMGVSGEPVEAWPYRLMPEYGPEGAVLPPPTKGNEVRVATIHRYKGLEAPVVVLCEIDVRVAEGELAGLVYVGATRARAHLVVVCGEAVAGRIGG